MGFIEIVQTVCLEKTHELITLRALHRPAKENPFMHLGNISTSQEQMKGFRVRVEFALQARTFERYVEI